jgi:hypothetical protein
MANMRFGVDERNMDGMTNQFFRIICIPFFFVFPLYHNTLIMSNIDHLLITDTSTTLTISNSNPKLELQPDMFDFFETINADYKLTSMEKSYKIFDDVTDVSVANKMIELQLNLKSNSNFIIINKIKLTNSIEQCLKDCYVTKNGKIVAKHNELSQKIINLRSDVGNEIQNMENGEICLHLFFKNKSLNALINNVICVSYVSVNVKNRLRYFSRVEKENEVVAKQSTPLAGVSVDDECAMMF